METAEGKATFFSSIQVAGKPKIKHKILRLRSCTPRTIPSSWGPRISRARPTSAKHALAGPRNHPDGNAREPSCAQDDIALLGIPNFLAQRRTASVVISISAVWRSWFVTGLVCLLCAQPDRQRRTEAGRGPVWPAA